METNVIFGKIYHNGHNTTHLPNEDDHGDCPHGWRNFWSPFIYVREELELGVGLSGCLTNILNIFIFTRRNMRNPTSTIFMALAIADFLFLFQQVFASSLHLYRKYNEDSRTLLHSLIEQTIFQYSFEIFHGWSIYLTLLLAIWRYLGVSYPLKSRQWCTARSSKWSIFSVLFISTIGIFLICLAIQIQDGQIDQVNFKSDDEAIRRHRFLWIYVLFVKFIPCTLLTFFFIGLIWSLVKARKRRAQLRRSQSNFRERLLDQSFLSMATRSQSSSSSLSVISCPRFGINLLARKDQIEFDRTTKTLVLVLLFLATEFPFGIVELVMDSMLAEPPSKSATFYVECYFPLLSFFVFDELISSAASFFVYLCMSNTFRATFIFHAKIVLRNFAKFGTALKLYIKN